ncbi:MAG: protein BatD, partial [Chitinophagaceae bacterium]
DYILKKGENVPDKVSRNMQLRLQTNKTSCFVGEPIVASYRLYTRLKSESKLTKAPSFNGFSVIDLLRPDDTEQSIEKLDGREYNVYTVRKSQLYPLQAGEIELEPATLDNNIQFIKEGVETQGMDGFLDGLSVSPDAVINQSVSLTSKPLTIHVKPLPESGKPGFFNGAVGKFDISATLEKNRFGADESGKLLVTVSGAGNLQLITVPEITWPTGLEAFDPKVTDEYDQATVPVSGSKTFSIPFTVNAKGSYRIPTIRFSYFDPTTASYKIDSTGPIDFTVVQGSTQPAYDIDTLSQKKTISFSQQIFSHREWIVGVIALLMILGLYSWSRREKKTIVSPDKKAEERPETFAPVSPSVELQEIVGRPQNPLQKTEECLNSTDCTDFYTLLNAEFKTWLAAKFSLGLPEVNSKKIISSFDKAGIDNDTSLKVQRLLQDIEWQLYTPFERSDSMHQLYSRAQSVLQTVDSYHQASTL